MASLLNRPAFGPYLQLIGANRAYEPAALAIIAFAITWALHGPDPACSAAPGTNAQRTLTAYRRRAMAFLEIDEPAEELRQHIASSQHFELDVEHGEFVSFLGPCGCGKTTTLRMVAGFETPTAGAIRIDGRDVTHLRPNQRNVGMVFQSYALFPNMTVAENVAFGLKVARAAARPRSRRASTEMLQLIKLPELGGRYPYQLSGGQQQRVALARALAIKPQVLLLDEPLSALDAKIRVSLREEIRAIQRELGITTIYVTHDQEEALSMSDRIVVMNDGRVEQIGTPVRDLQPARAPASSPRSSARSTSCAARWSIRATGPRSRWTGRRSGRPRHRRRRRRANVVRWRSARRRSCSTVDLSTGATTCAAPSRR